MSTMEIWRPTLELSAPSTRPPAPLTRSASRLVVIAFCLPLYAALSAFYSRSSRQLARLEAVAHTPLYSSFAEALDGAPTIRASHAESRLLVEWQRAVDQVGQNR